MLRASGWQFSATDPVLLELREIRIGRNGQSTERSENMAPAMSQAAKEGLKARLKSEALAIQLTAVSSRIGRSLTGERADGRSQRRVQNSISGVREIRAYVKDGARFTVESDVGQT